MAPVRFTVAVTVYGARNLLAGAAGGGSSRWASSHLSGAAEDFCLDIREGLVGDRPPSHHSPQPLAILKLS